MTHITRTTVAAACMTAVLATGGTASAASWQRTYLEPAIQAWMGVVTLLADDGEREGKAKGEPKCDGECKKGDGCKKCDRKGGECKGDCGAKCEGCRGKGEHKKHRHGHHGPRGDAVTLLHDINMRLARIEHMLAARGPGGHPMAGHHHKHHGHHGGHHARHHGMEGPKNEMYQRMSEARKKWENASPEERAEMKKKMEARMKEGRAKMEEAKKKWESASPEEREEMKAKWEARMKEGRAKMEEARKKWENASPEEREEMKAKWQARMKEGREKRAEKPEAPRPNAEQAGGRKAELENRLKRLEAELQRVREALKSSDS